MTIRSELSNLLADKVSAGHRKENITEGVLYYYGFRGEAWPTLEDAATRYNIGTKEWLRQILESTVKSVGSGSLPSLTGFIRLIRARTVWELSSLRDAAIREGIVESDTSIKGILNLIRDIDGGESWDLYNAEMERIKRTADPKDFIFLTRVSEEIKLKEMLINVGKPQGHCGVANLRNLSGLEGYRESIEVILTHSPRFWTWQDGDDFWYVVSDRQNILLNFSAKTFAATTSCEPAQLAAVLANALKARSHKRNPGKHPYPPQHVILKYLCDSPAFSLKDNALHFGGHISHLVPIEADIVAFLRDNKNVSTTEIRGHLEELGYKRNLAQKSTHYSPLIYIDKSGGRKNYVCNLVGSVKPRARVEAEQRFYEAIARRLKRLDQTDLPASDKKRKEQKMLTRWLFGMRQHEHCAICGRLFSISSLVAAHKKDRKYCTHEERVDPHIVMPLCLFGCDYMYGKRCIIVKDGVVRLGEILPDAKQEIEFINPLLGKKVDPRWLKGDGDYFV